ncbi:putative phosphate system positive regulatory protein [Clavispora lusitaniae]|uniref:Phosphate system positive regulatory protein n=2 Tax=Clavispora lusitaniae TaxID=36911 RepID=A0ACD0WLM5_CLALS|nr:Helix-loop-helix DNA-binding domain family protein [Clavispora lusitaniae]QFZ28150.1 putative phosphate system positive regulatory protein [Clavispora lusitaniae]QFZ33813.1 putative phosphate system positive regulatory protein [Clavispora lusitaniae]QFZ39497.1 putative phosphate system positive regulatory protein [Clavispora lusitaniae]QFZ45179.1 putative phosphate system positive regulatory protein [Clavispora lusitaniae]
MSSMDDWSSYSPRVRSPPKPSPAFADPFLLDQLDHNLVSQENISGNGTHLGGHISTLGTGTLDADFNLDAMEFVVDDLAPTSKAFPPSNFPQNTPALGPRAPSFQSPILPGQNEKSYNKEHLYHTQRRRDKHAQNTPLQSPAMTPGDSQVGAARPQFVAPAAFEPLTSPALDAADRRRSSSATFGHDEPAGTKRRTPHSTPILPPKPRRSPSLRKVPQFEQLPEPGQSAPGSAPDSSTAQGDGDSMLPPRNVPRQQSVGEDAPTLMGFTMNRLAESQSASSPSPSPALGPRKSDAGSRGESSSAETSPVLMADGTRREKPATKKATHKLAEQGRRNRMNQAVHELSKLIPPAYHGSVSIPSKATTVELASVYIRDLLREMDELSKQVEKKK